MLLAGGSREGPVSAELYDPSTGTFTPTGDTMTRGRNVAILLNNGKVLIAAARAELYDPATGTFTVTGAYARDSTLYPGSGGPVSPTATLLPDGRVLIAGDNRAELYDPGTGTFSLTGAMTTNSYGVYWHTATLLTNGRVLVAGGTDEFSRFAQSLKFQFGMSKDAVSSFASWNMKSVGHLS